MAEEGKAARWHLPKFGNKPKDKAADKSTPVEPKIGLKLPELEPTPKSSKQKIAANAKSVEKPLPFIEIKIHPSALLAGFRKDAPKGSVKKTLLLLFAFIAVLAVIAALSLMVLFPPPASDTNASDSNADSNALDQNADANILVGCAAIDCDDSNPCTTEYCDENKLKCIYKKAANESSCGENSVCRNSICVLLPPPDTNLPVISSLTATAAENSITLSWTTNEPADSAVEYSTTSSLGSTAKDETQTLNHTITASGLNPNTIYYYKASSTDASNNKASSETASIKTQKSSATITLCDGKTGWQKNDDLESATIAYSLMQASDSAIYAATDLGIYKTTDSGATWIKAGQVQGASSTRSVIEANDENKTLYVTASPNALFYKSSDKGEHWNNLSYVIGAKYLYSLIQAKDGSLYAGTSSQGKIAHSADNGKTWTKTSALAGSDKSFSLIQASDGTFYAGTSANGYVFKSTDGNTWERAGTPDGAVAVYDLIQASDGTLYAGSYVLEPKRAQAYKSADSGSTWTAIGTLEGAKAVYSVLSASDGTLYAGTSEDGDVFKSTNGGSTWTNTADLDTATIIYDLMQASNGFIYAATYPSAGIFVLCDN